MKKTWLSVSLAILSVLFMSNANATIDRSHVIFTNNTPDPISVHTELTTTDQNFTKGSDWDEENITLLPFQSKRVLWFSRNTHVKTDHNYQFKLTASNQKFSNSHVVIIFNEKGKPIIGSELTQQLYLPDQTGQTILDKSGLFHYPAKIWQNNYIVHARKWLPLGNLFSDFQVVLDKPESDTFKTENNTQLSVLTYNTQLMPFIGRVVNDLNQPEVRAIDIPTMIKDYDVVVMEELFDHDLRSTLVRGMNESYPYHTRVVGDTSSLPWTGGVMIFSKWPIEKEDQIIYRDSDGIDGLAAKGVNYAKIKKDGKYYHIFGTHVVAGGSDHAVKARASELLEFDNFIQRMNIPTQDPVIIAGDFNIDEAEPELQVLESSLHVNKIENIGYPYSADATTDTMNNGSGQSRIDYVFNMKNHKLAKSSFNKVIILRALYHDKMWPKFDLSDHYPVAAYFDFSNE